MFSGSRRPKRVKAFTFVSEKAGSTIVRNVGATHRTALSYPRRQHPVTSCSRTIVAHLQSNPAPRSPPVTEPQCSWMCSQKTISPVCWNRYIHFVFSQPVSFISILATLSFRMCLYLLCVFFPSGISHQNYVFISDDYQACWIPRPRCFDRSNSVGVNSSSYKCFAQISLSIWHWRLQVPTFHLSHPNGLQIRQQWTARRKSALTEMWASLNPFLPLYFPNVNVIRYSV